ncbi:hypothetical protein L1049_003145 [Liquidambar formosana]|uniref:MADS-box domain-containing protein n=1 Tax=Liquidambar formosana TaxID=63359 RepID=A0AAP0NHD8_LIQFO
MGRKIALKKIENVTRCQVTFSKRRSSLIKKAHDISVYCDVDVAFVTFSPSGRLSKFSSQKSMEEVLDRYINLPADKRYVYEIFPNFFLQEKLQKLHHIKGDDNKLHHLNKQFHIERQIKSKDLELQILEASLRDFEPDPEQEPSLAQLLWCERNLKNSLQHVISRKVSSSIYNTACPQVFVYQKGLLGLGRQFHKTSIKEKKVHLAMVYLAWTNDHTSNPRVAGFPSMHQSRISSLAPQTQNAPTSSPNQQAMVGNHIVPILANPQLGVLESPSMHSTETFGHYEDDLNGQDHGIPMFQFHTNSENVNWFASGNHNPGHNSNVFVPMNSERIESPTVYEPIFTTCTATTTINTTATTNINTNGGCDANENHLAGPGQVGPLHEHPQNLPLGNEFTTEELMGNDAREWDGFVLAENLNLEDLDIPIICGISNVYSSGIN